MTACLTPRYLIQEITRSERMRYGIGRSNEVELDWLSFCNCMGTVRYWGIVAGGTELGTISIEAFNPSRSFPCELSSSAQMRTF
jgi:hypothetical protein